MGEFKKMTLREIDVEVLVALGHSRKKIWDEYEDHETMKGKGFYYYIPSGKPRRTHMIEAVPVPCFTKDLNAVDAVIERLHSEGLSTKLTRHAKGAPACRIFNDSTMITGWGDTLALAFCLTFLELKTGIRSVEVTP